MRPVPTLVTRTAMAWALGGGLVLLFLFSEHRPTPTGFPWTAEDAFYVVWATIGSLLYSRPDGVNWQASASIAGYLCNIVGFLLIFGVVGAFGIGFYGGFIGRAAAAGSLFALSAFLAYVGRSGPAP